MSPGLEKQINLLDYALASLWRRRLKNSSVLVVFAAVIFLIASFHLVTTALTETAGAVLAHTPEIVIQKMSAGRQEAIPIAYGEQLAGLFGIKKIVPRVWGYYFDEVFQANYTVLGVDPAAMPMGEHLGRTLAAGEYPGIAGLGEPRPPVAAGLPAENELQPEGGALWRSQDGGQAVAGRAIQELFELAPGKQFSLHRPDRSLKIFTTAGLFRAESDLLTADLIALSLADARDLFQIPVELATDLCVYVHNPAEITNLARKISALLPDTRVLTRPQIEKTYRVVFGWRSGFAAVCLLAALAAFVILAWDKASGLSPEERREIAILKILGWETADLLLVRCWEALIVAFLAFLLGCTLAWLHVVFFEAALFRPVLVGWSVIHPPFALTPRIEIKDLLLLLAITVLPYLAATVIPTWRGAVAPAEDALNG